MPSRASHNPEVPSREEVQEQLAKILADSLFVKSHQLGDFLQYSVETVLDRKAAELKEYVVGIRVFGKPVDYSPQEDPIVRIMAGRLRARLAEYYCGKGETDPVLIEMPRGGYKPRFTWRKHPTTLANLPDAEPVENPTRGTGADLEDPAEPQSSIAVLPFTDMSGDGDIEYFGDGLAEETISALTQIPNLKVIARTSAFAFKNKNEDVRKIAEVLGVAYILEGSVRRAGTRLRVTAQLILAKDGTHLWSERYDRRLTDVFEIQDEISQAIAAALRLKLSVENTGMRRYIPNIHAYEAYLVARHHFRKGNLGSLAAKESYETAIELDPRFALAYVGLAEYYLRASAGAGILSAHQAMPLMRALAEKALEASPGLQEAHGMLGIVAGLFDYNWGESARQFRLAMSHAPVPVEVRQWYGFYYLISVGRLEDAITELELAKREDPLNTTSHFALAFALKLVGRYKDRSSEGGQLHQFYGNLWYDNILSAENRAVRGLFAEALSFAEKAYLLAPWSVNIMAALAAFRMREGDAAGAKELLAKLSGAPEARGMCVFHLNCGEIEVAADWFEKAIQQRDPTAPFMVNLRVWHSISRWPKIAQLMNLPDTVNRTSGNGSV
jgi:TolB-like protein